MASSYRFRRIYYLWLLPFSFLEVGLPWCVHADL
tara:strand:+ start:191 stop:292 length:102 start_codon:yes stop_codon:yes gene_type:complete